MTVLRYLLIMKNAYFLTTLLILCAINSADLRAAESAWTHNPDEALTSAAQQGSPLFVLIRIEANGETGLAPELSGMIETDQYAWQGAELIYPEASYSNGAVAHRVITWANRVGATQLPALCVLSPDGRPCGLIQGERLTDPMQLKANIDRLKQNYQTSQSAFETAEQRQGSERALSLHAALQAIDSPCRDAYHDVMQQIVAIDSNNALGLRSQYEPILTEVLIDEVIQGEVYPLVDAGAYDQAQAILARVIRDHTLTVEQHQLLLAFKAQLLHSQNRTQEAIAMIDQAIAINKSAGPTHERLVSARLKLMSQ